MGIADFFRPKYRHSDVRVRTEAVKALSKDDTAILIQVARTDRDIGVRRIAIEKIDTAETLADIASGETERSLRELAGDRAADLYIQAACGSDAERSTAALGGVIKLGDQRALVGIVVRAEVAAVRKKAFGELRDPRALAELAKSDGPQDLRIAAVARIDDGDVLRALAIDTTQKEVGLAAVDKLDDVDRLENIAQKAKNKAVRQRARKIVGEIAEAEEAKKPQLPDDVKRRRAEKAQLVRQLEGVAETFEFARTQDMVKAAEAAWALLTTDEGDDRFTKAAERYWKRKKLYDEQARTGDELRVIEREAREAKERAAAERAAREAPKPAEPVDPEAEAKRAEEAKVREAEREARAKEDEARRVAQSAEREARNKEDAERAVAIAASLTAMCDDMEQLATTSRDGRAIDRLLAQASKSFEMIGKVGSAERDAIADRYRSARGKLVTKAGELREAEDWERFANVPKAEALIATAKQMLEAPATPDLGNRLRGLQALWKEVGPMPQRRSKELWDQFKIQCDLVYDKVKGVRAVESEKFGDVTKVKEALIAEADALAESTEWGPTAEKLKALQAQWKQSGHLPRKQGDELWKRFRAACDKFFERRKPMLDAQQQEQADNLGKKQGLIARAQAIAAAAPGVGGWGKAIGEIKDLQAEWKDIGYVPRRDADTVYKGFRAACDALFAKRDESRDAEANAHRAEIDALKAEINAASEAGDVARAVAVRAKARELNVLPAEVDAMVRHLVIAHGAALKGSELDPTALRNKREKLIARAEELLPKQAAAPTGDNIAAQLANAMRKNAFGDLRFSGRDPVEMVEELRLTWADAGPILDDDDRAQVARFDDVVRRVLEAAGVKRSRRRTAEREAAIPIAMPHDEVTGMAAVTVAAPTAVTAPISLPPPLPEPTARTKAMSVAPPLDEVDTGWDLGESDPTATKEPEPTSPSATEMAGDGATEGDGIDTGWD